jgi:ABC-type lipoprotein release transport system permease subunit
VAFAGAAALFAAVALAALAGPAHRATATDPVEVLRDR